MAEVSGYVEKIKYRNADNGYTILSISGEDDDMAVVGTFPLISEGDYIKAEGDMVEHPIYGEQLRMRSYEIKEPEDVASMERYLGSGAIRGVGPALAKRIVKKFKEDSFRIIEEEPERLAEVKGISEKMAQSISAQMEEKKELRQAMMFLQDYGISMNLALKIYDKYGPKLYGIMRENPYRLAEDISGVGFKTADEIAGKIGIFTDSDYRIRSGILYCLQQGAGNGHTCLPREELCEQASDLLGVDEERVLDQLSDLQIDKKIVVKGEMIYLASYYYMELATACMLRDLNLHGNEPREKVRERMEAICEERGIEPDPNQLEAAVEAVNNGILIITGGPGTGKTTTINTIISYFEQEGMNIRLAAPTGRAAKRMTEATGWEAATIHRMLEMNGAPADDGDSSECRFERNESNPLEADAVIIDEASMVDIFLMHALLCALTPGTRLILVGDVNQLPSVGPGNVLRDMIDSGEFSVVRLDHIFRQAAESDIIVNAHKINDGEEIDLAAPSKDFLFIRQDAPDDIINSLITLVTKKLPGYVDADPMDIQIMTPMRRGQLGVEHLNTVLQQTLNPPSPRKNEKEVSGTIYRVGDKVMQVKNNYQLTWELRNSLGYAVDSGTGVFNGDIGIIKDINLFAEELTVEFDEGRTVDYPFRQLDELELAYAVTVHKAQGSEYPAVVIPMYPGPRLLMTRNLIYTAVTRAKKCVCLVGRPGTFRDMVNNKMEQERYTGLKDRIREASGTLLV